MNYRIRMSNRTRRNILVAEIPLFFVLAMVFFGLGMESWSSQMSQRGLHGFIGLVWAIIGFAMLLLLIHAAEQAMVAQKKITRAKRRPSSTKS